MPHVDDEHFMTERLRETFTRRDAEAAYTDWVDFVRGKDQLADWRKLMGMVATWRKEIFNYFDHRFTSGMVERMNRSIGDINRAGNGMDFQTLRAKAILRYGDLAPERRFRMYLTEFGTGAFSDMLEPDAWCEDEWSDDVPEDVLIGSGFEPSTMVTDLEVRRFGQQPRVHGAWRRASQGQQA